MIWNCMFRPISGHPLIHTWSLKHAVDESYFRYRAHFFLNKFKRANVNLRITWDMLKPNVLYNEQNRAVFGQILIELFYLKLKLRFPQCQFEDPLCWKTKQCRMDGGTCCLCFQRKAPFCSSLTLKVPQVRKFLPVDTA